MVHTRPTLPEGHGELLTRPVYAEWPALVEANRAACTAWRFAVGGMPAQDLRALARSEALAAAAHFSARLGVPVRPPGDSAAPIIATGHQPELYHPGVWVKDFLLQRFADETGATALDVVVDSDGFETLAVTSPCMTPGVTRCRQYLALGSPGASYASTPVPAAAALADFRTATLSMLSSLPAPAVLRHFERFAECLERAAVDAADLAELITFARRRYELPTGTDYLELPVTRMVRGSAFGRFAAHIALDARGFATVHNEQLAAYRAETGTRSAVQPFPDLGVDGDEIELPFWWMADGRRTPVWARPGSDGVSLRVDGGEVVWLPYGAEEAVAVLCDQSGRGVLAPKALALTTFVRLFCCDLFVHGVGGGRYDRVTDAVIRAYFGIDPPGFAVASITLYLPLGARIVSDEEVAAAVERLNRFEHNPDALLPAVDFDDPDEQARAAALVSEKEQLIAEIARPDADKKAVGTRIRAVNAELARVLAPLKAELDADLERLRAQRAASEILTDRTYPFCFWDPMEVADKVR